MATENIEMRIAKLEANMNYLKQEFDETLRDAYNRACADQNAEEAAHFARAIRNKILDGTDKYDTVDRVFNFNLPDNITATTMLTAVKQLIQGIKGIGTNPWSVYRQHLRDITTQAGFPFDIDWGQEPENTESEV